MGQKWGGREKPKPHPTSTKTPTNYYLVCGGFCYLGYWLFGDFLVGLVFLRLERAEDLTGLGFGNTGIDEASEGGG